MSSDLWKTQPRYAGSRHDAYADFVKKLFGSVNEGGVVTHSKDVAEAVWFVVTDPSSSPTRNSSRGRRHSGLNQHTVRGGKWNQKQRSRV